MVDIKGRVVTIQYVLDRHGTCCYCFFVARSLHIEKEA